MKKLLGGILPRTQQVSTAAPQAVSPLPSPAPLSAQASAPTTYTGALDGRQTSHSGKASARGNRGRGWVGLLVPSASAARKPTVPRPVSVADNTIVLTDAQSVDLLIREVVLHLKAVLSNAPDNEQFQKDLQDLARVVALATERLQQTSTAPSDRLQRYFASSEGVAMCEQTAFPSLILGFVSRMRIYLLREELEAMENSSLAPDLVAASDSESASDYQWYAAAEAAAASNASLLSRLEQPLRFLMYCLVAVASSAALLESLRCELPSLIRLAAEEYPPGAIFVGVLSSKALASLPVEQVNAGLAWYLHDCDVVAKTIRLVSSYAQAIITTSENATRALQLCIQRPTSLDLDQIGGWGSTDCDPGMVEAAVSEALGLATKLMTQPRSTIESFCLPSYDVVVGLKALVSILQKASKCSPVLLDDFRSSGGYTLLLRFLESCAESKIPELLHLLELLLPLGNDITEDIDHGGSTRADSVSEVRNVDAFIVIRDSFLQLVVDSDRGSARESAGQSNGLGGRNENLALQLLTTVLHVYTSNYANFLLLESKTQTLALILTKLPAISFYDAKVIVLRIVEYVCCAVKPETPMPLELLSILSGLFVRSVETDLHEEIDATVRGGLLETSPSTACVDFTSEDLSHGSKTDSVMLCECIIKILKHAEVDAYSKTLSGFGLLECGVYVWLAQIASRLHSIPKDAEVARHRYLSSVEARLTLWSTVTRLMLRGNIEECVRFRRLRVHQSLYIIAGAVISRDPPAIEQPGQREFCSNGKLVAVLAIFVDLAEAQHGECNVDPAHAEILRTGLEADLSVMLEMVQRFRTSPGKQVLLLRVLEQMLVTGGPSLSVPWKLCQGFEVLVALMSSLEHLESEPRGELYLVMDLILHIVTVAIALVSNENANGEETYFKQIVGYPTIASCLVTSGILVTENRPSVLNRVFELIAGGPSWEDQVRNGDAAHILFLVLPSLPADDGVLVIKRLLAALERPGTKNCLSGQQQIRRLVVAGVLRWVAEPSISLILVQDEHPLKPVLSKLIEKIATAEELSTFHLRDFLRVAAKGMPQILGNHRHPEQLNIGMAEGGEGEGDPEVGLQLLENVLRNPAIPHVVVGGNASQKGGYVHAVNNVDRAWPPSSGYSFACWLKFPSVPRTPAVSADVSLEVNTPNEVDGDTVPVGVTASAPLCEGWLAMSLHGQETPVSDVYGVLIGKTLTVFPSNGSAIRNEHVIEVVEVTAAERTGPLQCLFWSHERQFCVGCVDVERMDMWWRAVKQSERLMNDDPESKSKDDWEVLSKNDARDALTNYACIMSVYSLQSAGCALRVYFDEGMGYLCLDTASGSTGGSGNSSSRRAPVVFKEIQMADLCHVSPGTSETMARSTEDAPETSEKVSHWHHLAFTHRKAVMGNSLITVYLDGYEVATKKLHFPPSSTAGCYQVYVGNDRNLSMPTPPLTWHIGPTWLTEQIMTSGMIAGMYLRGPAYTGQFTEHVYRPAGDWPEALASSLLSRIATTGIDLLQFSKRLQLSKLGRSSQKQWRQWGESEISNGRNALGDAATTAVASLVDSMAAKRDELADGLRFATGGGSAAASRKEKSTIDAFRHFIRFGCSMDAFGSEIERLLGSFELSQDMVLFSLNTKCSDQPTAKVLTNTKVQLVDTEPSRKLDLARVLPSVGGISHIIFPLLDGARRCTELKMVVNMLARVLHHNPGCMTRSLGANGYALIAGFLCEKAHLVDESVLKSVLRLAVGGHLAPYAKVQVGKYVLHPVVVDAAALSQVVLSCGVREKLPHHLQCQLVSLLMDLLVPANPNALFNARQLRRAGFMSWAISYVSELANEKCEMVVAAALERRWCYPTFQEPTFDAILQYALSLLRAFIHAETHVDDIQLIAEMILLSMTSNSLHVEGSPARLILLQFLLQEIEYSACKETDGSGRNVSDVREQAADGVVSTIVDSILHQESSRAARKSHRGDGRSPSSSAMNSPSSGIAGSSTPKFAPTHATAGLASVLVEVMSQDDDDGRFIAVEVLLALRILLSLAQAQAKFAEHLLRTPLYLTFERALQRRSTDSRIYIPLVAYISSISISDTDYFDAETLTTTRLGPQPFSLPAPGSLGLSDDHFVDQVWALIGSLLHHNCQLSRSEFATSINVMVLEKITFQVETSDSFFAAVCKSSDAVLSLVDQCLLSHPDAGATRGRSTAEGGTPPGQVPCRLHQAMEDVSSSQPSMRTVAPVDTACLYMVREIVGRALVETDDFASLMIHLLELLSRGGSNGSWDMEAQLVDGQKCWLALVSHLIEGRAVLLEGCSLLSITNVCSLAVALARYLANEDNHNDLRATGSMVNSSAYNCFGTFVLDFLLQLMRACADPKIASAVGGDKQRFFLSSLVYSAQTVVLNELNGLHRGVTPPQHLLDFLVESKEVLLQSADYSGVLVYSAQASQLRNEGSGDRLVVGTKRATARGNHLRNLSNTTHKEFGLGVESDRSFILSLVAKLFQMLVDDTEHVRHAAIILWQFLLQHRLDLVKELMVVETRATVLQNIATTKKESVDVFHGGFDRLLDLTFDLPASTEYESTNGESNEATKAVLNQQRWCQFQLWLTENFALLSDMLVTRTESTQRHFMDVLGSCLYMRKMVTLSEPTGMQTKKMLSLDVNFGVWCGARTANSIIAGELALESIGVNERKQIAHRTLLRFSNIRDGATKVTRDALLLWRERSESMKQARSLWYSEDSAISWVAPSSVSVPRPPRSFEDPTTKHIQSSVFQCNSFRCSLDTSETPTRMRVRLIRKHSSEAELKTSKCSEVDGGDGGELPDCDDCTPPFSHQQERSTTSTNEEPFQPIQAFHEAVETFRGLVVKASIAPRSLETTQEVLEDPSAVTDSSNDKVQSIQPVDLARSVFRTYLADEKSVISACSIGVSSATVIEIDRAIVEAEANPFVALPSTLFDAANAEVMNALLCAARSTSFQCDVPAEARGNSSNSQVEFNESDDDEALSDEESEKTTPLAEIETRVADEEDTPPEAAEVVNLPPDGSLKADVDTSVESKLRPKPTEKTSSRYDGCKLPEASSDEAYHAIAHFFHRDDATPLQCYNAVYINALAKTSGLLVVSRFAIYFIPGYGKLCNPGECGIEGESPGVLQRGDDGGLGRMSPVNCCPDQRHPGLDSPAKDSPSGNRKRPKRLLRMALGDLSTPFLHTKATHTESFMVVPLGGQEGMPSASASATDVCRPTLPPTWKIKHKNVTRLCRVNCQLRPVGLEVFDTSGETYFLQLESFGSREEVVKLLLEMPLHSSSFWTPTLRGGAQLVPMKQIRKTFTKRWLRGAMSNFEYLMCLNTLAGRSFNDLTQYPVFPWVLADYSSESLDLESPHSFRDLSKPMGAISESRAEQFRERYAALAHDGEEDSSGLLGTSAFHYGTHYSCSAYVVNYLIRLEPFTSLALELQGGVFDHPDRLFRSLASSWVSASRDNFQDVRELIPEFFYLPEFLHNANSCVFGTTQSGDTVSHVVLPPWAHGDPREFVRLHRRALESKYVSEHLHEWIDLIFGAKQTGRAAVEAQNVFMSFTYEGAVDTERITDPVLRAATLAQIENFGQTPSRLFSSPHPPRKVPTLHPTPLAVAVAAGSTLTPASPASSASSPVVSCESNSIENIEAFIKWHTPLAPALVAIGKDYTFLKKHSAIAVNLGGGAVGEVRLVHDKLQCERVGCSLVPPRFAKCLDWSGGGGVIKLHVRQQSSTTSHFREDGKALCVIEGVHDDLINCAVLSDDGELLITGGQDAVVNVTECSKAVDGRREFREVTKLVGHETAVVSVAISQDLHLIASGSADCSALLWDLRSHVLLRELAGHSGAVRHVSINAASLSILTATTSELRLWSINGDLLAASSSSAFGLAIITCAISTQCEAWQSGVVAVTGHDDGAIALWGLHYPTDLAQQRQADAKAGASTPKDIALPSCSSNSNNPGDDTIRSSSRKSVASETAVPISSGSAACRTVIPSCRLYILKLLLDHRASVTALTLGVDQRQLLSGDAEGNCIRWVDDSVGANVF